MNISGLLRSVMGEAQAGPPKALELKTGEVVKGTVIQSFSDHDALVNIGGVQVRARLETPLKPGEATMLQVQPESETGQVVLKPLQSSTVQIADVSLGEVLKSVGLGDSPAYRQLVQLLHQAGVALTKENVQAFARLGSQMPASLSVEEWLPSAVVAFQKGLPLTPETVVSVKQAVQGQPLHETLAQLAALAERELESPSSLSPQTRELLRSVRQLVEQVRQAAGQLVEKAQMPVESAQGAAGATPTAGVPQAAAGAGGAAAGAPAQAGAAPAGGAAGATPTVAGAQTAAGAGGAAAGAPAQAANDAPATAVQNEHLLSRLMKALGVEHEHQSLKLLEHRTADLAGRMTAEPSAEAMKTADTIKSVLLQLSQASDVPASMKEVVQQAVQQITGQQLLLSQDRSALFSHITLFVPVFGANGEQTAAVHIQSRKGKSGRLDADNCRLVFDLQMKALGDTMVDVQVINRIVSLHIHNDLPFVRELLESNKDEIAQGLASVGYQFISMKCSPYPEKTAGSAETAAIQTTAKHSSPAQQLASVYGQKPYKGLDIRL